MVRSERVRSPNLTKAQPPSRRDNVDPWRRGKRLFTGDPPDFSKTPCTSFPLCSDQRELRESGLEAFFLTLTSAVVLSEVSPEYSSSRRNLCRSWKTVALVCRLIPRASEVGCGAGLQRLRRQRGLCNPHQDNLTVNADYSHGRDCLRL
jgi:hypothetical protein